MRLRRLLGSLLLSLLAICTTVVLCEVVARVWDGAPLLALRLPPRVIGPVPPPKHLNPAVGGGELPPDVDPEWLEVSPPPLARGKVDPVLLRRISAAGGDIAPFELFRIWNRRLVEALACQPGSRFQKMPQPLRVFDPPEPSPEPPFRYPPSQTLPGGLVTNRFGWRGPDLPIDKPSRTIRLAFVGASTTVGLYQLPFSYPEYVVHWLNLWAQRAHLDVHFDGINAGREGIGSHAIAAVIRQELLPAEPDLVIYYEGANQSLCVQRAIGAPPRPEPSGAPAVIDRIAGATRAYSQIARRLEGLAQRLRAHGGYEPPKPALDLDWWPSGIDEAHPDIRRNDLPRPEAQILRDLESARTSLEAEGAELALSSFIWLVFEGLRLDPVRDVVIYNHLNGGCWPYRYADLRRAVDLHNHILEQYAAAHRLPFIDAAAAFPPDPELFYDAVHLNTDGTRLQAWIVFRALVPIVRSHLESGVWPRPDRVPQTEHPVIGPGQPFTVSCPRPAGSTSRPPAG